MTALTTRQRDLLNALLDSEVPLCADDLAAPLQLTTRQVKYGLQGIKHWLSQRNIELVVTPGVGIKLNCTATEARLLQNDLSTLPNLQLILSPGERQQLLALTLMVVNEPKYLSELENLAEVSRTTIIKDLDIIESWLSQEDMHIIRRQNYGIEVDESEDLRQKIITMLLWGQTSFGNSLFEINYTQGLVFELHDDAALQPLVKFCDDTVQKWDMKRAFGQVAYAETQLGARFTDDAFLHLALVIAIQTERLLQDRHLQVPTEHIQFLQSLPVWDIARMLAKRSSWKLTPPWRDNDIAGIAMWILAAPRNENLPGDLETEPAYADLIQTIREKIVEFYDSPEMGQDQILHNGLINQIIPACLRQKFNLWQPSLYPYFAISDRFKNEYKITDTLIKLIEAHTPYRMTVGDMNNIAALLRAARIRLRPQFFHKVLVVCPGGMATAQLLMSRLEARFPRLGPLEVISMRELTEETISSADLIITTVPLSKDLAERIKIIQVHPLLLVEDVEEITQYIQ